MHVEDIFGSRSIASCPKGSVRHSSAFARGSLIDAMCSFTGSKLAVCRFLFQVCRDESGVVHVMVKPVLAKCPMFL